MVPYKIVMGEAYAYRSLLSTRWRNVPHTSKASMREIHSYFGDRLISKDLWPPISPHLTPPAFFLWGLLKGRVYSSKSRTIGALKDAIRRKLLPLPMSHYQMTSPICRLVYKSAWMMERATFSICSRSTLFCNKQGKYMSIFIGNHPKITKLLRKVWVS
jgi:hypothetical protein